MTSTNTDQLENPNIAIGQRLQNPQQFYDLILGPLNQSPLPTSRSGRAPAQISPFNSPREPHPSQIWLLQHMQENPHEVVGMTLNVIYDDAGRSLTNSVQGVVLDVIQNNNMFLLQMHLSNDNVVTVNWFQAIPENQTLTPKPVKKSPALPNDPIKCVNEVLEKNQADGEKQNASRHSELQRIASRSEQLLREIAEENTRLSKFSPLTVKELQERISHAEKLDSVDRLYFSTDNKVVIITKMLKTLVEGNEEEIGRFAITIAYPRLSVRGHNLDFQAGGYFHPNLLGNVFCLGEHNSEVANLAKTFDVIGLVEFFTVFLTTFEGNMGHPYMNHFEWLKEKKPLEGNTLPLPIPRDFSVVKKPRISRKARAAKGAK